MISSELKALAATATRLDKKLKASHRLIRATEQQVNELVDDMILRAFLVVLKAAEFFDIIQNDKSLRLTSVMIMETVMEEEDLTPTTDPMALARSSDAIDARSRADSNGSAAARTPSETSKALTNGSLSPAYQPTSTNANRLSQGNSLEIANRLSSATICHRVSLAGPSPLSQAHNLVSERLTKSQDTLVSHLACLMGRLQLEFVSRPHLALGVKQAITSGGDFLLVMDIVSARNSLSIETLAPLRAVMYDRIQDLYQTARDVLVHNMEEAIVPQEGHRLHVAAVGCVKVSGTCYDKTKWVIGQIGDFEFEFENSNLDLGFDLSAFDSVLDAKDTQTSDSVSIADSNLSEALTMSTTTTATSTPAPRPANLELNKPLPDVPLVSTPVVETSQEAIEVAASVENTSSVSSLRSSLPPLPKLSTEIPPAQDYSPTEGSASQDGEFPSFRTESMTASSSASATTYISRTSESSMTSQTSTRATTPDLTHAPRNRPSVSELSLSDSTTLSEESDDAESKLLEKTYAHELIFNKEGQVTGGSLPALVERLTTHESTPDAMFVSTFYLTFRLFCTPLKLAEALIDRFNYVGEAPHVTAPVRLRTYNVFKGWMESHWQEETDSEALPVIKDFAETRLKEVLPSAGKRLLELAEKVTSSEGTLVPRLVSSISKSSTSGSQFIPAETPLPSPNLSRGQAHALATWKAGGVSPSIMDFDALELARQITIKQIGLFCSITPEELLGSKWTKNKGVGAPNVKAMSAFTTGLSNLVVDTILQFDEIKKRAAVIKHWIKIGSQFLALNNYDGLMAVTCALNDSSIKRLRMTWDTISSRRKETLKSLQAIVEISQNHKALRARLAGQVPPCLPYVGMFLTDLTFVDAGNPAKKTTDTGLTVINFDKHMKTAKCIGELQRFQIPYRLTEVPDFQEWILSQIERAREIEKTDKTPAQVLHYRQSLLLEPKEVQQHLKTQMEAVPSSSNMFSWIRNNHSTHGLATSAQV